MKKSFVWMTLGLSALAVLLSGAFFAGAAWAADAKFDSAVDNLVKARALLEAAENPGVNPPFGYFRQNAVLWINLAMKDIERAKAYADAHQNPLKK